MILHGYALADLDQMTSAAVMADRLMAMDVRERRDIAWSAIAEALVTAQQRPQRQDLIRIGWQAIYRHVRDGLRQRGYADGERDWSSPDPTRPRFVQYWSARTVPSHEDRVIERIATGQVLSTVTGIYRAAIVALAVHSDYRLAAESLGISYTAFIARINTARRRFLTQWHQGETPHRPRRTDRRVESHSAQLATHCGKGHEWTAENTRTNWRIIRGTMRTRRFCRACERDRGKARKVAKSAQIGAAP